MPKGLSRRELDVGKAVKEAYEREWFLLLGSLEKIVGKYDAELVGKGAECVVIDKKGKPEEVTAITYQDLEPDKAKEIFYLQRIFSTLFPHNFPHFYTSTGTAQEKRKGDVSATIRQRIRGRPPAENYGADLESTAKYPFGKVLDAREALDLPIEFDSCDFNFALSVDGGVYYLDSVKLAEKEKAWNLPAIREYMNEAKTKDGEPAYTDISKRIVEKSIRRLAALGLAQIVE